MKRFHWFEILLIIVVLVIQLYAAFSDGHNFPNNWFVRDDAYYYFKVAENIGLGHGSTFDGINPTNGYHPLWMLVCIPIFVLARFDLILPLRVLLIVISLFSIATAILLYRLISGILSPPVGMLVAVYWVFNFYIQETFYNLGLESGIALFFIALSIYTLYRLEKNKSKMSLGWRQVAWLSIIATLTMFSRLDLVFFAIIIGIWIIFRDEPMRYLVPLDILAIVTATLLAFVMRLGLPKYYELSNAALAMISLGLIVKLPIFFLMNLYQRPTSWKPPDMLKDIILAVMISSGAVAILTLGGARLNILPPIPRVALAYRRRTHNDRPDSDPGHGFWIPQNRPRVKILCTGGIFQTTLATLEKRGIGLLWDTGRLTQSLYALEQTGLWFLYAGQWTNQTMVEHIYS